MPIQIITDPLDLDAVYIVTQGNANDSYVTVIAQCINGYSANVLADSLKARGGLYIGFEGPVKPGRYPVSMRFNNAS